MRDAIARDMQCQVATYDQYIRGDVYGFTIEECETCETCGHEEWTEVDSCWGFYGSDPTENGMADSFDEEELEMAKAAEVEYPH